MKLTIYGCLLIIIISGKVFSQSDKFINQSNSFIKITEELTKASIDYQLDGRTTLSKLNEVNLYEPSTFVGYIALKLYEDFLHTKLNINITRINKSQDVKISFAYEYIKSRLPDLLTGFNTTEYLYGKYPDINKNQTEIIIKLLQDKSLDEKYVINQFNEEFEKLKNPVPPVPINLNEVLSELTYPEDARKSGIEDNVKVTVIVDRDGDFIKINSYEGTLVFEKEVIRLVEKLKFTPGKIFGEPAIMSIKIPFSFKLRK